MISTTVPPTTVDVSSLATASALATVDTVVDAIKAVTDLLPDAGALTSVSEQAPSAIVRRAVVATSLGNAPGTTTTYSSAMTAGVYYDLVSVTSSAGYINFVCAFRGSAFSSGTLSVKLTVDGTAVLTLTDSASTTSGTGIVAVGDYINGYPASFENIRFKNSFTIAVASSVAQAIVEVKTSYVYRVD